MLEKIVNIRRILVMIFGGLLLVLWVLYLIMGSGENKTTLLILTPILSIVIYGFMRFAFKVVLINASLLITKIFIYFFLIVGTFGIVTMIVGFIAGFPNGLSPALGAFMGLVIAVLSEANKIIHRD
jgi:hypothetical protein